MSAFLIDLYQKFLIQSNPQRRGATEKDLYGCVSYTTLVAALVDAANLAFELVLPAYLESRRLFESKEINKYISIFLSFKNEIKCFIFYSF